MCLVPWVSLPLHPIFLSVVAQVQERRGRLPESQHGSFWNCGSNKADHEEHGEEEKTESPQQWTEWQLGRVGAIICCGDITEFSCSLNLLSIWLLPLWLLLLLLRGIWGVISAQSTRGRWQWLSSLLRYEQHSKHRWHGRLHVWHSHIISGQLWPQRHLWSRSGSDWSGSRPGNGRGLKEWFIATAEKNIIMSHDIIMFQMWLAF